MCLVTQFSSVAQSCPTLRPHGLQHARFPCPSPTPWVYSNSYPLNWWCHPTISSCVVPFSFYLQSLQASGSFKMSQFVWGGQSIGVSASTSVLPMNIQHWFPLGWTGWISLQSKGLSRVFSNTSSTLCNPMDCSPPGSFVHGIIQARMLQWVAISSSRRSFWPKDWTRISCIGRQNPYHWATWEQVTSIYKRIYFRNNQVKEEHRLGYVGRGSECPCPPQACHSSTFGFL